VGEHRYDDRLTDQSLAAVMARRRHHQELLDAARAIDGARLQGEDVLSLEILVFNAGLDVREDTLLVEVAGTANVPWAAGDSPLAVNQMWGPQFSLPQLARATRFGDEADYRHFLSRWAGIPASLRQLQAILEAGREAGWQPPRVALERLPAQFDALLSPDTGQNPLFEPFRHFPDGIAEPARAALREDAAKALQGTVIPALAAFRDYLAKTWIPAAPQAISVSALPHGPAGNPRPGPARGRAPRPRDGRGDEGSRILGLAHGIPHLPAHRPEVPVPDSRGGTCRIP
jgi:uncharacterized protein (DUF885 family)